MITGSEILKDLQDLKKKVEFVEITYPGNDIWPLINKNLNETISLLKRDKKIFGYD